MTDKIAVPATPTHSPSKSISSSGIGSQAATFRSASVSVSAEKSAQQTGKKEQLYNEVERRLQAMGLSL